MARSQVVINWQKEKQRKCVVISPVLLLTGPKGVNPNFNCTTCEKAKACKHRELRLKPVNTGSQKHVN